MKVINWENFRFWLNHSLALTKMNAWKDHSLCLCVISTVKELGENFCLKLNSNFREVSSWYKTQFRYRYRSLTTTRSVLRWIHDLGLFVFSCDITRWCVVVPCHYDYCLQGTSPLDLKWLSITLISSWRSFSPRLIMVSERTVASNEWIRSSNLDKTMSDVMGQNKTNYLRTEKLENRSDTVTFRPG